MPSGSAPQLPKHKTIRRTHPLSHQHVPATRSSRRHFLALIREVAHPFNPRPTNQLISFLNLHTRQHQSDPSLGYIPSIEQMISQPHLDPEAAAHSLSSIERGFLS